VPVAWIQSFLELVYRGGGIGGQVRLTLGKSQLEPSRDGENMRRDREDPILDVIKEDRRPSVRRL
jgi:hypothetical protein